MFLSFLCIVAFVLFLKSKTKSVSVPPFGWVFVLVCVTYKFMLLNCVNVTMQNKWYNKFQK